MHIHFGVTTLITLTLKNNERFVFIVYKIEALEDIVVVLGFP